MNKTVSVYDLNTKRTTFIPDAELVVGMIPAEVAGVGDVWIDPLQTLALQTFHPHPPFSGKVRDLIKEIKASLDAVYPKTLEDWVRGFRCEESPAMAVSMWLHTAALFECCTVGRKLSLQKRKDCLNVLVYCAMLPGEKQGHILQMMSYSGVGRKDVEEVIQLYNDSLGEGGLAHQCWLKTCDAFDVPGDGMYEP